MKIILAHKFYRPFGGTEEYVRQVEAILQARGHDVVPFAMSHPDNWATPYASYFVPEIDYRASLGRGGRARRALGAVPRLVYWPEARRRFSRLLRDVRPDLVHIQNIAHQISPSVLYAAADRHLPVVMTANDFKLVCPGSDLVNGRTGAICSKCFGGRYWHAIDDRCQDDSLAASVLVAVEMGIHHRILRVYERHVRLFIADNETRRRTLVAGGIPAERIRVLPQPFDATRYEPLPGDGSRVLFFGRLDPDKAVDQLIRATAIARVPLDIVGSGTEEASLRALAAAKADGLVTFHGPLYGSDLEGLVRQAAVTALPSRQMEGTPYAVLQSFAWQRPVIATAVGALPEVVTDGMTGLIVPPGDPDALAAALRRVFDEPGLARDLGRRARSELELRYSPLAYYESLIAVYAEAAAAA